MGALEGGVEKGDLKREDVELEEEGEFEKEVGGGRTEGTVKLISNELLGGKFLFVKSEFRYMKFLLRVNSMRIKLGNF